jgi:hypothetical protein
MPSYRFDSHDYTPNPAGVEISKGVTVVESKHCNGGTLHLGSLHTLLARNQPTPPDWANFNCPFCNTQISGSTIHEIPELR